jgi:putative restriction endonuclease
MLESDPDHGIRLSAFQWLNEQIAIHGEDSLPRPLLEKGFIYQDRQIHLIGAAGIWKPAIMQLPLTISTTPNSTYHDSDVRSGIFEYSFQGYDKDNWFNRGLREVKNKALPIIYFKGTIPGRYRAMYPVYIIHDDPAHLTFTAQVDQMDAVLNPDRVEEKDETLWRRKYATVVAQTRLHQQQFRDRVIYAYNNQCSLCRLRHSELLDAAHIIADKDDLGDPIIPNGLSLCKIHHAAFDHHIIGITPDYTVKVCQKILEETDGPMLRYGLQSLNDGRLQLPAKRKDYPDRERLEMRYSLFLKAG